MLSLKRQLIAALVVLAITGGGAGAVWAQDKDRIVTERQEAMKQQWREMVTVRNYFQDKGDQAAAIAAMDSLQKSLPKVPDWFPAGTGIGEVPVKTRAKAEIWREHDKFLAADKTVIEYPEAHHTLEFEPDPTRYFADLVGWLARQARGGGMGCAAGAAGAGAPRAGENA